MEPIFGLPPQGASALVLGMLSGYPVGAQTAASLYASGQLTKEETERLLGFCSNAGPAFIFGMVGGLFMDSIRAGRWLQPFVLEAMQTPVIPLSASRRRLSVRMRHNFARHETLTIFRRVWKWVIVGVAVGAALHGLVPANWFAENLGAGQWWTVPVAVLVGIPLYSNVTGIVPGMEGLLTKGMPVGTTMAFCMSAVAASIPEVVMLRQVMTAKLQAAFLAYLWVVFTFSGWLLNALF